MGALVAYSSAPRNVKSSEMAVAPRAGLGSLAAEFISGTNVFAPISAGELFLRFFLSFTGLSTI